MRHTSTARPALPTLRHAAAVVVAGFAAASSISTAPASAATVSADQPTSHRAGPVVPARVGHQHVVDGLRLSAKVAHQVRRAHRGAVAHAAAGDSAGAAAATSAVDARVRHAFDIAEGESGKPYVYGAAGPYAFDCSGLTSYAYHLAGFALPRTAAEQAGYVHRIDRSQMKIGDFVFFYEGDHVYHVGLFDGYAGGVPYIVHAPHPGAVVRREAIWTDAWFPGTLR